MKNLNNNILIRKQNPTNSIVVGLDACKITNELIRLSFLESSKNNSPFVVISEDKDLCDNIFATSRYYNRNVVYIDASDPDCPYYNVLAGKEQDVINRFNNIFFRDILLSQNEKEIFFKEANQNLVAKSIKLLKRLYGDNATLLDFEALLYNTGGQGKRMVMEFSKMPVDSPSMARENSDIAQWFLNDYYSGLSDERDATRTYEYNHSVRNIVSNLNMDNYLRRVINPPREVDGVLSFKDTSCIIINLSYISNRSLKDTVLKLITTDWLTSIDIDVEKILYSDILIDDYNADIFKNILINSKIKNLNCILSTLDIHKNMKHLSGYINNYLLSQNLSINDYKYFKHSMDYPGVYQVFINNYGNLFINNEEVNIAEDINYSKLQKKIMEYQIEYRYEKERFKIDSLKKFHENLVNEAYDDLKKLYLYEEFKEFFPDTDMISLLEGKSLDQLKNIINSISKISSYEALVKSAESKVKYDVFVKNSYLNRTLSDEVKKNKSLYLNRLDIKARVLKNIVKLAEIISSDLNISVIKEEIDFIERKYIEINNSKETRIDNLLEDVPFIKEDYVPTSNENTLDTEICSDDIDILGMFDDEDDL